MAGEKITFEGFLEAVAPDCREFIGKFDRLLRDDGYKLKLESKASGLFASYSHPVSKRSIANLFFRKKGFFARIYADNCGQYAGFLDKLPPEMEREIARAPACKRLLNPDDCNPKCVMGYDFTVRDNRYKKCRYSCFQFEVTPGSMPVIAGFVANEKACR